MSAAAEIRRPAGRARALKRGARALRIARPLAAYAVTVFFLLTLNFFLPRALPGDPIATLGNPTSSAYVSDAATRAQLRRYYGLDRPMIDQYGTYLAGLARGDLGVSTQYAAPVGRILTSRLGWTLLLVGSGLGIATLLGVLGGVHSGWRHARRSDRALLGAFLVIDNIPVFFLATVAVAVLAIKLRWLPLSGATTPFADYGPLRHVLDVADHLVLPAAVMALQFVTLQYLITRAAMVSELGADHMLLGRAKGLPERRLKYRYAARNALLPSVTVLALEAAVAINAAIFVETVFAYPGIGRLMFDSVATRDYPALQGCFLVLTLVVVTFNLLADLACRRLDPRTR